MIACEDDMSPVIQLWDLRNAAAMTPARELLGHNKASPEHMDTSELHKLS